MEPAAADLIERLREPGESYEALAARLPISLSTLYRWKRGSTEDFARVVALLRLAGWLNETAIRRDLQLAVRVAGEDEAEREAVARLRARLRRPPREDTGTRSRVAARRAHP